MPFTEDFYLPSEEELKVQELTLSTPILRAGGVHFGKYCDEQCKEFMLCRKEENDARKCLDEGKAVTACGVEFFRNVKKHCRQELEDYAACLEWNSEQMKAHFCRNVRKHLESCLKDKMNLDTPPVGYFTEIRVHKTNRPYPEAIFPIKEYKDDRPSFPEDYPKEKTKYGHYYFF